MFSINKIKEEGVGGKSKKLDTQASIFFQLEIFECICLDLLCAPFSAQM